VGKDNEKEFLQKLFEEEPICSVILQCPRSKTKAMIKQKNKAHVEKQVEKHVKKKATSKVKENQKMLQWMKMDSNELKWVKQVGLESWFNL
jgi:hypothetical protein